MKAIAAAAVGVALIVMPARARAADPGAPFSGAYIGLNAGAGWGSTQYATDPGCPPDPASATFCNAAPDPSAVNGTAVSASGTGTLSATGFTGGVQGGYNWQSGAIVYGAEADFGALDLSQSTIANGTFPFAFAATTYALTESWSTDWLATIRGRLGFTPTTKLLIYATGGIALSDFKFSSSYADNAIGGGLPGGSGFGNSSGVRTGWALGGGGEWLLDGPWSIKAEYLYVGFPSRDVDVPTSNTAFFTQTIMVDPNLMTQLARVGLNYRY
jgi:outer membrane immunogenic protein